MEFVRFPGPLRKPCDMMSKIIIAAVLVPSSGLTTSWSFTETTTSLTTTTSTTTSTDGGGWPWWAWVVLTLGILVVLSMCALLVVCATGNHRRIDPGRRPQGGRGYYDREGYDEYPGQHNFQNSRASSWDDTYPLRGERSVYGGGTEDRLRALELETAELRHQVAQLQGQVGGGGRF